MEANRMREHQERRSLASLADAKAELASNQTRLQENERRCKEARDDYDRIKSDARTIRASLRAKLLNGEKEFDDITQRCSEKESEVADIESQIDNLVKKRQKASAEKEKVETQKALMLKDLDDQVSGNNALMKEHEHPHEESSLILQMLPLLFIALFVDSKTGSRK